MFVLTISIEKCNLVDMNPYQQVTRSWPPSVVRQCFELYLTGHNRTQIKEQISVPISTQKEWSVKFSWASIRQQNVNQWHDMAEAIGQASLLTTLQSLTASSKVIKQANVCLDSGTPLTAAEIASIASALTDTTELVCRLLGK